MDPADPRPRIRDNADRNIGLEGYCAACKTNRFWTAAEAVETFGADTIIKEAEKRLRCPCGATGRSVPGISLRGNVKDHYRWCREDSRGEWSGGIG